MKLLPFVLGVSLAVNAALLVVNHSESGSKTAATPGSGTFMSAAGSTSVAGKPGRATGEAGAIARALNQGEAVTLRDELRAAGVDEDLVRMIVSSRLWKKREARLRELSFGANASKEWWKQEDWHYGRRNKAQRDEMRALQKEIKDEMERVLGPDPDPTESNPWLERQYGFLPPAKRDALIKIAQDYQDLQQELQEDMGEFRLPADQEKLKFLEEEKRRDMAAVLTPEELEAYEMRQSSTASQLLWQMTRMDATEEEYRAIYAIRREFDEANSTNDPFATRSMGPDDWKKRNEAEKAMREQIKAALGEERYKVYTRSNQHEYQQLMGATKRFGLPGDTPAKVFDLRDEIGASGVRIADDKTLTPEQKGEALRRLADAGRKKLATLLGSEVAQAYKLNTGTRWLEDLEKGMVTTFGDDGSSNGLNVTIVSPKPPATKK
ncbi:MAG: hypothetical protein RLZZ50_186 [Verrucomicrobiota bacterium]